MADIQQSARAFLDHKRIAVAGVSRKGDTAANIIYKKLRDTGYQVYAVNPNAEEVEGDHCYPSLSAIPDGVEAVVIGTPPTAAVDVVRQCGDLGINYVWMHRSFGAGSVDDEATRQCEQLGISVIPGSCPMMFLEPVDFGHKCIRWMQKVTGGQARPVGYEA